MYREIPECVTRVLTPCYVMVQEWKNDTRFELEAKLTVGHEKNDLSVFKSVVNALRSYPGMAVVSPSQFELPDLGGGFCTITDLFYDQGLNEKVRVSWDWYGKRVGPPMKKKFWGRNDIKIMAKNVGPLITVASIGICLTHEDKNPEFVSHNLYENMARLKERISFQTPDGRLQIDCSRVREGPSRETASAKETPYTYEIEVEVLHNGRTHDLAGSDPMLLLMTIWNMCNTTILGIAPENVLCVMK
jgi:hypothetical protein